MAEPETRQWTEPRFLDEAHAWIRGQLTAAGRQISGPITQDHIRVWSTVMRVPTDQGATFFKANHDQLRHEAAVAEFLGRLAPSFVPPPIAIDADRGWMLLTDAGTSLRDVVESNRSLDPWLQVLPRYADLQLDTANKVDELIAVGVPDMRLDVLPARFDELIASLSGLDEFQSDVVGRARNHFVEVQSMSEALARYELPDTLQHDDLNDGQVYFLDGRPLLLDWADACISQPFFSLSVALEGVISWGVDDVEDSVDTAPYRDIYLERFADRLGRDLADLRAAAAIAVRLGWACRAVNGHVEGDNEPTIRRLQMLVDGRIQ